jgi:hypothetical protein
MAVAFDTKSLWIEPDLVENAKSAFPTRSLDAQRTRAHTLHRPCIFRMTKDKHTEDHGGEVSLHSQRRF